MIRSKFQVQSSATRNPRPATDTMGIAGDTIAYVKTFIRDRKVASVMPSSQFLVRRVCGYMDFSRPRVIVEYGSGLGVFSKHIVQHMGPESRLLLIETNPSFVERLRPLASDARVELFHEKAQHVKDVLARAGAEDGADYVLSGIPFSFFDDATRHALIDTTKSVLKPGGKFLVYQHYNHMEKPLRRHFERVETDFELLNLPPIRIQAAVK